MTHLLIWLGIMLIVIIISIYYWYITHIKYVMESTHIIFPDQVPYKMNWLNVQSALNNEDWTAISQIVFEDAGQHCEICGQSGLNQGYQHSVECHELWKIDDKLKLQQLVGLQALCPKCHLVKHMVFTRRRGLSKVTFDHMCNINNIDAIKGKKLLTYYRNLVKSRHFAYRLDLQFLNKYADCTKYDFNGLDAIKCTRHIETSDANNKHRRALD